MSRAAAPGVKFGVTADAQGLATGAPVGRTSDHAPGRPDQLQQGPARAARGLPATAAPPAKWDRLENDTDWLVDRTGGMMIGWRETCG